MASSSNRPQAMVEDDDISLNSTASEAYDSDTEFTVDRILAESGEEASGKFYLISWEGYPEEKHTWEPKSNIGSDTLKEWHERRERERMGLDKPYDVARWKAIIKKLEDEKADRHQRRVIKRQKIKKAKLEALAERKRQRKDAARNSSDSSSEALEYLDEIENAPGMKLNSAKKHTTSVTKPVRRPIKAVGPIDDNLSDLDAEIERKARRQVTAKPAQHSNKQTQKPSRSHSETSSDDMPLVTRKAFTNQQRPSSSNGTPVQQRKPAESVARPHQPLQPAGRVTDENLPPRPRPSVRGGKGATRGGLNFGNVFRSKEPLRTRPTLLDTSTDPSKAPKPYSTMRLGYKAYVQGRAVADRAPDITKLPGGLMDPSKSVPRVDPSALRNAREQAESEPPTSELFVPPRLSVAKAIPAPVYQQNQLKSGREVCFFWHRKQMNKHNPDCINPYTCERLHYYEPGAPISGPPLGWVEQGYSGPEVCFFWDRHQKDHRRPQCGNGEECSRLHSYEDGAPISGPPPGWVEKDEKSLASPSSPVLAQEQAQQDSPMPMDYDDESHHDNPDILPPWQEPVAAKEPSSKSNSIPFGRDSVGASEKRPVRATCYFWNRAQLSSANAPCRRGDDCHYLHRYEKGTSIASAPKGCLDYRGGSSWRPASPPVCNKSNMDAVQSRNQPFQSTKLPSIPCIGSPSHVKSTQSRNGSSKDPLARPPWDPYNSEHAICHFWNSLGHCSKGHNCKYYHNSDPSLPIAPSPDIQREIRRETTCLDWANGNCHYLDCWFMHRMSRTTVSDHPNHSPAGAPRRSISINDEPKTMRSDSKSFRDRYFEDLPQDDCSKPDDLLNSLIQPDSMSLNTRTSSVTLPPFRPTWDPRNPLNAICYFYSRDGFCYKRDDCIYLHSKDPNLPIAPDPRLPLSEKSRLLVEEDDRGFSAPTAPGRKRVRFANDDPANLSDEPKQGGWKSTKKVCRYWQQGYCQYGSDCFNLHESPLRSNTSRSDDVNLITDDAHDDGKASAPNSAPLPLNRMTRGDSSGYAAVSSPGADIDMLEPKVTQPDVGQQGSDSATRSNTVVRRKRTLDEYKQDKSQKALKALGANAKDISFGSDRMQRALFDVGNIDQSDHTPWKQEFASTAEIVLDHICLAQDFQARQGYFQRRILHHGSLQPADPNDSKLLKLIDHIVEEMVLRASGLMSIFTYFAILIFPGQKEEWGFLEQPANIKSRLRYFLFEHNLEPGNRHVPAEQVYAEPYRTLLAAKLHGLRLKNLLPPCSEKENPYNFFLLFPISEKQMLKYFSAWILASHAESKVFDSLAEGAWDCFVKTYTTMKTPKAVIFVHESMAASLHQVPHLKHVIKQGGIIWWNVSDSTSLYPLFHSVYSGPQTNVGRLKFTRLFPHGCAILLTPSFLIAEPEHSSTILNWFLGPSKSKFAAAIPGTWKLVVCHNFTSYLLDLANSKAKEKEVFEKQHRDSPAKDPILHEKKLSYGHCETRYKLLKTLLTWQQRHAYDLDSDSESDHNDDNESPLVQAPGGIDPDDEEGLINWFAGWSMLKLDSYRKFVVVGTNSANAKLASRMKEAAAPECMEAAGDIKAQPTGEFECRAEDSDVSMDLGDTPTSGSPGHGISPSLPTEVLLLVAEFGLAIKDAQRILVKAKQDLVKAQQLCREEQWDAKIPDVLRGGPSLINPVKPLGVLPPLRVGDADLQRAKEVPVSAVSECRRSYTFSPQREDILSPQLDPSSRDASRRTSLIMSPDQMSVGSADEPNYGNKVTFQHERHEGVQERTEHGNGGASESGIMIQTFEPTSQWYRRMMKDGKAWEHIIVCSQWDNEKSPGVSLPGVNFAKQIIGIP
ncbi:uncharacterized protein RCO7_07499 [Rhynchosporium graminicola]|uniref:Chromo domain-containing protein n=1 Tax=Rhynchosporium graminicola TaxID=2792576 RepID=A0A1E1LJ80_9HELO|nr:uncharacterized protein RCO7_07499 [Rhynchosporium commune]